MNKWENKLLTVLHEIRRSIPIAKNNYAGMTDHTLPHASLVFRFFISSSIPMTNMKSMSPIWLRDFKFPKVQQRIKQPKIRKISPTMVALGRSLLWFHVLGCPIFLKQPKDVPLKLWLLIWDNNDKGSWENLPKYSAVKFIQLILPMSDTGPIFPLSIVSLWWYPINQNGKTTSNT
jgi:hypothetical protein